MTTIVFTPSDPGFIEPGSEQWREVITPSKVAAILGVSRWESAYRLWHRMKGLVPPLEPKDAFDVGHDIEPYAAKRWRRKNPGWRISSGEVQFHLPAERFGFPIICTLDRRASSGRARRVVEIKLARDLTDLEKFGDDLTGDLPEDFTAQVITQMLFTGWTRHPGHCLVIGPNFNERLYEIGYDPDVADWILQSCKTFWASLAADEPPELDDTVATYECVRALHPDIDKDTTIDIDPDLGVAVHNANDDSKDAENRLRGLKTRLLDAMGNAQTAMIGGTLKIATRSPNVHGTVTLNLARTHPALQQVKGITA